MAKGRIDRVIEEFERLQREAHEIIDVYVDGIREAGVPFGVVKHCAVINRAGQDLNYVNALKIVQGK